MASFDALMSVTSRPDAVFARGEGSYLWDGEGKRYLDFVQGWAVNCLGHCHPALVEAISGQARRLINCSPAYYNEGMVGLAELLVGDSCFDRVFFANSGAEANEGAIKLARKWGQVHRDGAYEIVTMEHAFHGRTLATMSASDKPGWDELYEPKVGGFVKVPLNDLAAVKKAIGEKTVGIMVEPIQGEAGVIPATDEFMRGLRKLADERGILLIADEIQTGIGRTGRFMACEHSGVEPDIATLGKGLGGGVPLTALLAREEVCCFAPGEQGGTFNGNPLMTTAGRAVVEEVLKPGFLESVRAKEAHLEGKLEEIAGRFGFGKVRGRGLLLALDLEREIAPQIVETALAAGLLLNAPRPDTLRFMPALTVSEGEIDELAELLEGVCAAVVG